MNNGQGSNTPSLTDGHLVPANGIVTWEQYQRNLEQISRARDQLATIEAQNRTAYERYLEQELRSRVEAGRQAERQLAMFRAQRDAERQQALLTAGPPQTAPTPSQSARPKQSTRSRKAFQQGNAAYAPQPQQPQQHTNTPIQDYPTQPYYRSHVHVDTMNSVAQGQYQPAASTSVFHSQTNHALFAPSGSGNPTTHHTSTTGASQHQPSMSTTRQEQAQSQKAARANQRHTDNTHVSTQEDALGTGIIRAKNTYAAHATVPAPVEYSVDHQIILRDIRDEVYGLLKNLGPAIGNIVIRLVFQRLQHKLDPQGTVRSDPVKFQTEELAQSISTIVTSITGKVQDQSAQDIILVLRDVRAKINTPPNGSELPAVDSFHPFNVTNGTSNIQHSTPATVNTVTGQSGVTLVQQFQAQSSENTDRLVNAANPGFSNAPNDAPAVGTPHSYTGAGSTRQPVPTTTVADIVNGPSSATTVHQSQPQPPLPLTIDPRLTQISAVEPSGAQSSHTSAASSGPSTPLNQTSAKRAPNPSTLARDILRSLGKPKKSEEPSAGPLKRKRQASISTPEKKQKADDAYVPTSALAQGATFSATINPGTTVTAGGEPIPITLPTLSPDVNKPAAPAEASSSSSHSLQPEYERAPEPVEEIITPGAEQTELEMRHEQLNEDMRTINETLHAMTLPTEAQQIPSLALNSVTLVFPSQEPVIELSTAPVQDVGAADASAAQQPDDGEESVRTSVIDLTMDDAGDSAPVAAPSSKPRTPEPQQAAMSSPKTPLFLPGSPSEYTPAGNRLADSSDSHDAEMVDEFVPTGLLGLERRMSWQDKGKQRATEDADAVPTWITSSQRAADRWKRGIREDSAEQVIETSDVEEQMALSAKKGASSPSRRNYAYVLVPPIPAAAARLNARLEDRLKEEDGRRALYLSRPRLSKHHCGWHGCDAVLDSAEKLGLHVQLHAGENEEWNSFTCQWEKCPEFYSDKKKLAAHLRKKHSNNTLVCAYEGCDLTYATPKDLARHHISVHGGDALKPTAALTSPHGMHLPPLPHELAAYMTVPRRVSQATMSHQTHVWLGVKVAANITCYVHPGSRANAAKPSRLARHVAECVDAIERKAIESGADPREAVLRMARDEYDDWIEYGSQGPKFCSDLDSAEVTRMVDEGLILGATIEDEEGENVPAGRSNKLEAREPQEGKEGRGEDMGADRVSDGSQAGKPEAHGRGDADFTRRDLETRSSLSADDVTEAARRLVDEQRGSVEATHENLTSRSSGRHSQREGRAVVAAEDEIVASKAAPGWTALSDNDDEAM